MAVAATVVADVVTVVAVVVVVTEGALQLETKSKAR